MIRALWVIMAPLLTLILASCATAPSVPALEAVGPVQVEFVGQNHWLMEPDNKVAVAARDPAGGEWMLINTDADMDYLVGAIQHEMAHLLAWRIHGEDIEEHGPKFRAICRQLVTGNPAYYCKGD